MVVKHGLRRHQPRRAFESSVISYGSQTSLVRSATSLMFESSVISYGSQTFRDDVWKERKFESSVISYGSQTSKSVSQLAIRLRVV